MPIHGYVSENLLCSRNVAFVNRAHFHRASIALGFREVSLDVKRVQQECVDIASHLVDACFMEVALLVKEDRPVIRKDIAFRASPSMQLSNDDFQTSRSW